VDQLRKLGHPVDKVEFILMGGTFMSLPASYRRAQRRGGSEPPLTPPWPPPGSAATPEGAAAPAPLSPSFLPPHTLQTL